MNRSRRSVLVLLTAALLIGGVAEAQETMATRFFVVPKIGSGTFTDPLRPKYFTDLNAQGVMFHVYPWSGMDYGKEDTMLVGADLTAAQVTTVSANLDVTAIPTNLDSNVSSAALATIQNKLEGIKIPGDWVTTSTTYRQVIGTVGRIFLLMQRFDGINQRTFFQSGITLDTRMNQLTTAQRNSLQGAASSMGLDSSFVTNNMTVRTVLKTWVQSMGSFTLRGETF